MRRHLTGAALAALLATGGPVAAQTTAPAFDRLMVGGAPVNGVVATNAALKAYAGIAGHTVLRSGFAAAGDGGAMTYTFSGTACSLASGAGDDGSQVKPTTGIGCWLASFSGEPATPQVWGAKGDGTTDDTAELQAWLNYLTTGKSLRLAAGTYRFTSPLTVAASGTLSNVSIAGSGPYSSVLSYQGAATTGDLFAVGNTSNVLIGWRLSDFRITSTTTMTSGTGLLLRNLARSSLRDVVIDGQDGPGKLWNGVGVQGFSIVDYYGAHIRAQNDGLWASNSSTITGSTDLKLITGKVSNATTGLHFGGGVAGLSTVDLDVIANGRNMLIDSVFSAAPNLQFFFTNTYFDTPTGANANITVNDVNATSSSTLNFIGTWISGSIGTAPGMDVVKWPNGTINLGGGGMITGVETGVMVRDTTTIVTADSSVACYSNRANCVDATAPTNRIHWEAPLLPGNPPAGINARAVWLDTQNGFVKNSGIFTSWLTTSVTGAANAIIPATPTWVVPFPNAVLTGSVVCAPAGFANGVAQLTVAPSAITVSGLTVSLISTTAVTSPQTITCTGKGW